MSSILLLLTPKQRLKCMEYFFFKRVWTTWNEKWKTVYFISVIATIFCFLLVDFKNLATRSGHSNHRDGMCNWICLTLRAKTMHNCNCIFRFIFRFEFQVGHSIKVHTAFKDVHIVVSFAYLSSSYRKFEWAENVAVQARTKKLSRKKFAARPSCFFES